MRLVPVTCASLALLASGCFMDHDHEPPPDPPEVEVDVVASITGATLGDDCPDTEPDADADSGACAPGVPCPSFCQQSNVQLVIETSDAEVLPLTWEVIRITLHDFESGDELEELEWRDPRVWDEAEGYVEWDELLPAPSAQQTTYDLTAPDWGGVGSRIGGGFWSHPFQLRMVVEVDGERRTLESEALYRVSDIDT